MLAPVRLAMTLEFCVQVSQPGSRVPARGAALVRAAESRRGPIVGLSSGLRHSKLHPGLRGERFATTDRLFAAIGVLRNLGVAFVGARGEREAQPLGLSE